MTVSAFLPVLILSGGLLALVAGGVFLRESHAFRYVIASSFIVLIAAAGAVVWQIMEGINYSDAFYVVDNLAHYTKLVGLVGCAISLFLLPRYFQSINALQFEIPLLILVVAIGMCVMASSNHLLTTFLALELQSLPIYVLVSLEKKRLESSEAGIKYFVLGAVSSGFVVYGAGLVYGATGVMSYPEIARVLDGTHNPLLLIGMVMLICGIAFKLSAAPFHMWTPDVYEGAPTPITAFMATAPKFVVIVLLLRLLNVPFGDIYDQWAQVIGVLAFASLAVGTLGAMRQDNVKRFLAYGSIGHIGFALIGMASGAFGAASVLIYATIYMVSTLTTFSVVLMLRDGANPQQYLEKLSGMIGLSQSDRTLALVLLAIMFSLAGIPPLAGFFAKLYVFQAALLAGNLLWLVIAGVLFSVVSAFYYLRIIHNLYFQERPESSPHHVVRSNLLFVTVLVGFAALFTFFLWAQALFIPAEWAVRGLGS